MRSVIDIVVFDRLDVHSSEMGARRVSARAEYTIQTMTKDPKHIISGIADYVLGYKRTSQSDFTAKDSFESISVVVEVKKWASYQSNDMVQAITYIVGIQQHRMALDEPKRIVDTTYAIVQMGSLAISQNEWNSIGILQAFRLFPRTLSHSWVCLLHYRSHNQSLSSYHPTKSFHKPKRKGNLVWNPP
jgi:hypothetical protein